jgi:hypothetical protein
MFKVPELYRVTRGPFASRVRDGNNGAFFIPTRPGQPPLKVIASDGEGWDHVSVSLPDRCPTWDEMCRIVAMFWDEGDCVMQLHPPRANWISNHPYCLHLWRPTRLGVDVPMPPSFMVGYQELGDVLNGSPEVKAEAQRRYRADNLAGPSGGSA